MKSIKYTTRWLLIFLIVIACNTASYQDKNLSRYPGFRFEEYTIRKIQEGFKSGEFTCEELVQAYLDRIDAIDKHGPRLNSVICVNPDALAIARGVDKEFSSGKFRGLMHGIPVLLKDNIDTHDKMPSTAGSLALAGSYPVKDSQVAAKLREAGAVILGKTNLSEWANFRANISSSGWSGVGGQTKNPYATDRNPCGSSSGSAVAVSSNLCMVAIGTETNGSIVCPSTTNGIVGIKPTVGLISRSGIIPISFTQDTPGPMARTVEDAAICLGALCGRDSADPKTLAGEGHFDTDYAESLVAGRLKGKRIGWYKGPSGKHIKVDKLMEQAIAFLKNEGVEIVEISKIYEDDVEAFSFEVLLYEFRDGINKYLAGTGEDAKVKDLQELIEFNRSDTLELKYFDQHILEMAQEKGNLDSEEYQLALNSILQATRAGGIDRVMDEHRLDALVSITGSPAWKTDLINGDNYLLSSSSPAAISGYPSITVPMGNIEGLPVGASFFGRAWSEPLLIEIAYAFEQGMRARIIPQFKL
jgi:amidase